MCSWPLDSSATTRTWLYSSTRSRVSKSAWPTSVVRSSTAAIGEGFLSTTRYRRLTYRPGLCGSLETTFTGTEAPYAARSGAMICTVPGVVSIAREGNSFSRRLSHSGDESAWAAGAGSPPGAACAHGAHSEQHQACGAEAEHSVDVDHAAHVLLLKTLQSWDAACLNICSRS